MKQHIVKYSSKYYIAVVFLTTRDAMVTDTFRKIDLVLRVTVKNYRYKQGWLVKCYKINQKEMNRVNFISSSCCCALHCLPFCVHVIFEHWDVHMIGKDTHLHYLFILKWVTQKLAFFFFFFAVSQVLTCCQLVDPRSTAQFNAAR